jgi:hypothetical protein
MDSQHAHAHLPLRVQVAGSTRVWQPAALIAHITHVAIREEQKRLGGSFVWWLLRFQRCMCVPNSFQVMQCAPACVSNSLKRAKSGNRVADRVPATTTAAAAATYSLQAEPLVEDQGGGEEIVWRPHTLPTFSGRRSWEGVQHQAVTAVYLPQLAGIHVLWHGVERQAGENWGL